MLPFPMNLVFLLLFFCFEEPGDDRVTRTCVVAQELWARIIRMTLVMSRLG